VLLGIVTGNVSLTAPVKLRAAGFDPAWFPIGAYGSEALERNDLPALALERACRFCGHHLTPTDVTIIGDTEADIACARAIGARAVAVTTGFTSREALAAAQPDHLLDDLSGLLPLLM
jgi:phosphoglycolate phosphatase